MNQLNHKIKKKKVYEDFSNNSGKNRGNIWGCNNSLKKGELESYLSFRKFKEILRKNMLSKNQNGKALVIVAHCDDAVLWMGGTIHHLRDWE
jgi:hypothetical protein